MLTNCSWVKRPVQHYKWSLRISLHWVKHCISARQWCWMRTLMDHSEPPQLPYHPHLKVPSTHLATAPASRYDHQNPPNYHSQLQRLTGSAYRHCSWTSTHLNHIQHIWTPAFTSHSRCPYKTHDRHQCRACRPPHTHSCTTPLAKRCAGWSQPWSLIGASSSQYQWVNQWPGGFPGAQPPCHARNPPHTEPISSGMSCTQWH